MVHDYNKSTVASMKKADEVTLVVVPFDNKLCNESHREKFRGMLGSILAMKPVSAVF